jgi:integrase
MTDQTETHGPKIRETRVRVKGREYPRTVVDFGIRNVDGKRKRKRKTFKTRAQAERAVATWQAEQKILTRQIGKGADRFLTGDVQDAAAALHVLGADVTLSEAAAMFKTVRDAGLAPAHVRDAGDAVPILNGKATLTDAARFYMDRHFPKGGDRTIGQLVEDYIEDRQKVDRRPATISDIRNRLGCAHAREIPRNGAGILRLAPCGFARDFAGIPAAIVTTEGLVEWMDKHCGKRSKRTWRHMRVHLAGLFNFAKEKKYISGENPTPKAPKLSNHAKVRHYVMPVEDVETAMLYTAAKHPDMVPYMALCLFAGIRPTECTRLEWKRIDFTRREIDIIAEISKTGDERYVSMSDNLVEWLLPYRQPSGLVYTSRKALADIRKNSGVRWELDCMRHSFGSYHMGMHDDAGKTALQMGHRKVDTTFQHYRRAVRKEDAARFWEIMPAATGENVIAFRAKAG